jgi:hypothetical protein
MVYFFDPERAIINSISEKSKWLRNGYPIKNWLKR